MKTQKEVIVTEELLQEFKKVPATAEGIQNFIQTHNYKEYQAFKEHMTLKQKEACIEAVKIIMKNVKYY